MTQDFREEFVNRGVHVPIWFLIDPPFTPGQLDRHDLDFCSSLLVPGVEEGGAGAGEREAYQGDEIHHAIVSLASNSIESADRCSTSTLKQLNGVRAVTTARRRGLSVAGRALNQTSGSMALAW